MELKLYTDGNLSPGPCLGFVIRNMDDKILRQGGLKLAAGSTNNVCEYSAVITGLHNAKLLGATVVHLYADSKLIVEQCSRRWQCKEDHLREYLHEIWEMIPDFEKVTFQWIPRAQNSAADEAARAAWT